MSVVHVLERVMSGHGRGISALAVAAAQYQAGWDVRLLVSGVRSLQLLPAAPVAEPLLGDLTEEVYRDVSAIDRVSAALQLKTSGGDTLVSHDGIGLTAACRLENRRVVAAVHSEPLQCLAYLPIADLEAVRRRTDRWVAWGSAIAARLVSTLKVDPHRITVSAQAVSPGRPPAHPMSGSPACISVARIDPVKNHSLMLHSLVLLAESLPDIHWHMVGGCQEQPYLRRLQQLATDLQVSDRVTWHGYRRDVAATLLGSDVAVLTSHSEGVPRAIQEAMVLAIPTVMPAALATDISHAGLPVGYRQQEPQELAAAVQTALSVDPGRLAAAARWVQRRWGWDAVLADWHRVVTEQPTAPYRLR